MVVVNGMGSSESDAIADLSAPLGALAASSAASSFGLILMTNLLLRLA